MEEGNSWEIPGLFQRITTNVDGERTATITSMEKYYNRRIQRTKEEREKLKEIIQQQMDIIDVMEITNNDLKAKEVKEPEKIDNEDYEKYSKMTTDQYSSILKTAADFSEFFNHFPLVFSKILDNDFSIDINKIGETIQQFPTEKRNNFYDEYFRDIRDIIQLSTITKQLLMVSNELELDEIIGSQFPQIFGFQRVIMFRFDEHDSMLTVIKQKLSMRYKLLDGLIEKAAKTGNRFFVSNLSKNAKRDDFIVLGKSQNMWIVPLQGIPYLLIFYDKKEEITAKKDLIITYYSKVIYQSFSIINLRDKRIARVADFQNITDAIVKLSAIGDMKNFLKILQRSLESLFDCESVRLFRVRRHRSSLTKYGADKPYNIIVPIGTGIVSNVIVELDSIIIDSPELSISFDQRTDRAESDKRTNSMMVVPVFEGKRVKWIVAMYNKKGKQSFNKNDRFPATIFAKSLNSLISSVLVTSSINEQMRDSSRDIKDTEKLLSFISKVKDVTNLSQISKDAIKHLDKLISYDDATIYTADFEHMRLDGTGNDAMYSHVISYRDQDPAMKYMLTQTISMYANKVMFCPLISKQGRTKGMFVIRSTRQDKQTKQNTQSFLRTPYQIKGSSQSKIVKKLSGLAQHQLALHTTMIPSRIRNIVTEWSTILSTLTTASKIHRKLLLILSSFKRFAESNTDLSPTFNFMYTTMLSSAFADYPEKSMLLILGNEYEMQFSRMIITGIQSKSYIQIQSIPSIKEDAFKKPDKSVMYNTHGLDSFSLDEVFVLPIFVDIASTFGITEFLGLNNDEVAGLVKKVRSYTKTQGFRSWRMTLDHVQFCFFFISTMGITNKLTGVQKTALFLFFLCYYAEPFEINKRFLIQSKGRNQTSVRAFILCDSIGKLQTRKQISLMDCLSELDKCDLIESSGTSNVPLLIALVSKFSYCMREEDVSKELCKMRFKEELADDPPEIAEEIGKSILDFENRNILQPSFGELCRLGYSVDSTRKILADNMSVLTRFSI